MKNILTKRSLYTVVNVVIVLAIIAYFGFREFQKVALHQFLPEETIYKNINSNLKFMIMCQWPLVK